MEEFRRKILKLDLHRIHKVTNSLGVYDAYKWIRKRGWLDIGRPVTEKEFYSIIRKVNSLLADSLLQGFDIKLPHHMGSLELRKYRPRIALENGKIITSLPIDWDKTLKLWASDEDSYKEKILVRTDSRDIFKVFYNKKNANYNNQSYMCFDPNRDLKIRLKQKIKNKAIDAFEGKYE